MLTISLASALGGLLFGYDWVVIGGAKPFYEVYFNIGSSPWMQGWVMGSAIAGCLAGVTASGSLADRYGRKPLLVLAAAVFVLASLGTGAAADLGTFVSFRLLGGVGIGLASNISPMYIAEVSPAGARGRMVSLNQLAIVVGILSAQAANWLIADKAPGGGDIASSWNGLWGWRWMFWACTGPAALFLVCAAAIPESPRWLAARGHINRARAILIRAGGPAHADGELAAMRSAGREGKWRSLFKGRMPRMLAIGMTVAVFQQWCGINVIFNYAQEVFTEAGYGISDILFNIVITGATNVVFTIVGMNLVDMVGRRRLLLAGSAGLACIYCLLGFCYFIRMGGVAALVLVVLAIACYAATLAPVVWVVISEIFPTHVRGKAMAVATFALWAACFALTYSFPPLNAALGAWGVFWLYGAICVGGFIFVRAMLPETMGKSLEDIEEELKTS